MTPHTYEVTAVRKSDKNDVILPPLTVYGLKEVAAVKARINEMYSKDTKFTVVDKTNESRARYWARKREAQEQAQAEEAAPAAPIFQHVEQSDEIDDAMREQASRLEAGTAIGWTTERGDLCLNCFHHYYGDVDDIDSVADPVASDGHGAAYTCHSCGQYLVTVYDKVEGVPAPTQAYYYEIKDADTRESLEDALDKIEGTLEEAREYLDRLSDQAARNFSVATQVYMYDVDQYTVLDASPIKDPIKPAVQGVAPAAPAPERPTLQALQAQADERAQATGEEVHVIMTRRGMFARTSSEIMSYHLTDSLGYLYTASPAPAPEADAPALPEGFKVPDHFKYQAQDRAQVTGELVYVIHIPLRAYEGYAFYVRTQSELDAYHAGENYRVLYEARPTPPAPEDDGGAFDDAFEKDLAGLVPTPEYEAQDDAQAPAVEQGEAINCSYYKCKAPATIAHLFTSGMRACYCDVHGAIFDKGVIEESETIQAPAVQVEQGGAKDPLSDVLELLDAAAALSTLNPGAQLAAAWAAALGRHAQRPAVDFQQEAEAAVERGDVHALIAAHEGIMQELKSEAPRPANWDARPIIETWANEAPAVEQLDAPHMAPAVEQAPAPEQEDKWYVRRSELPAVLVVKDNGRLHIRKTVRAITRAIVDGLPGKRRRLHWTHIRAALQPLALQVQDLGYGSLAGVLRGIAQNDILGALDSYGGDGGYTLVSEGRTGWYSWVQTGEVNNATA